jgi:YebC/PmpR family DNA-binding regulatory protein
MSGHSKWKQIKHKKEASDAKRGQAFTRLAREIKQAALAGADPTLNRTLAEAIARAKRANMPQANIDRLLHGVDAPREEVLYEAFGPDGLALLITSRTDNSRRTVAELRHVLKSHGGTLGARGSVLWKFSRAAQGNYAARFPQPIADSTREKLRALKADLEQHPDISQIVSDAVE